MQQALITPEWRCAKGIELRLSSRLFGRSAGQYASLNLGLHVDDVPETVQQNRARVARELPAQPLWLDQVHGDHVVEVGAPTFSHKSLQPPVADASFTRQVGVVLAIMVADCLPIVLASCDGKEIAVVHAGWRGLANGILERVVDKFNSTELQAWLGPAIGPCHYEVDHKVRDFKEAHILKLDNALIKQTTTWSEKYDVATGLEITLKTYEMLDGVKSSQIIEYAGEILCI